MSDLDCCYLALTAPNQFSLESALFVPHDDIECFRGVAGFCHFRIGEMVVNDCRLSEGAHHGRFCRAPLGAREFRNSLRNDRASSLRYGLIWVICPSHVMDIGKRSNSVLPREIEAYHVFCEFDLGALDVIEGL